jgi:hypothetical protein
LVFRRKKIQRAIRRATWFTRNIYKKIKGAAPVAALGFDSAQKFG